MNEKKVSILISAVLILTVIVVAFIKNRPENLYSHISVGCSVESYSQRQDSGYVVLKIDNAKRSIKEIKVEDKKLQKQLSEENLTKIIGIDMLMTFPAKEIENAHMDIHKIDALELLCDTNAYDKYTIVTGISLK